MNWKNLKNNLCPKCGKDLANRFHPSTMMFVCPCGFRINTHKFKTIVNSQITEELERRLDEEEKGGEVNEKNNF